MPTFLRPVKTLGNREYALEKAANPNDPIRSAELDGDFDTLYAGVNGNLDTTNLKATAGILGSQLSAAAGIVGGQIAATTITGANLVNQTVTVTQLAIGASGNARVTVAPTTTSNITTTETTVVTLPSLTTRGGLVLLGGTWDLTATLTSTVSINTSYHIRPKRDGTTIAGTDIIPGIGFQTTQSNEPGQIQGPIPCILAIDVPAAGAHVYTVTVQTASAALSLSIGNTGLFFAMEFA